MRFISSRGSCFGMRLSPTISKRVEDPQKGRIYVMRPSSFGAAISMGVNDKEKKIGKTGPKTFLCWERSPGRTTIYSTSENTTELPIDVDPGQVYYVLQRPHIGLLTARNTIELISDKTGKYYLDQCKPPKMVGEK
jgi:hypothetical protein